MKLSLAGLASYFATRQPPAATARAVISLEALPSAIYAIGDIHGCRDLLRALEHQITEDAEGFPGPKLLVYLGDYVDRGPDSAGVLDHLLAPAPAGFARYCLAGNHEVMMLEYVTGSSASSRWVEFGGFETLQSYGIDPLRAARTARKPRQALFDSHIPAEHIDFLRRCPLALSVPGVTFVHAGLRPGLPLSLQSESDMLWIRDDFLNADWPADQLIVHGHTPAATPQIAPGRLGIDTGAFATGRLTAVRLMQGSQPVLLSTVG